MAPQRAILCDLVVLHLLAANSVVASFLTFSQGAGSLRNPDTPAVAAPEAPGCPVVFRLPADTSGKPPAVDRFPPLAFLEKDAPVVQVFVTFGELRRGTHSARACMSSAQLISIAKQDLDDLAAGWDLEG